jgi:hypothetical protein
LRQAAIHHFERAVELKIYSPAGNPLTFAKAFMAAAIQPPVLYQLLF